MTDNVKLVLDWVELKVNMSVLCEMVEGGFHDASERLVEKCRHKLMQFDSAITEVLCPPEEDLKDQSPQEDAAEDEFEEEYEDDETESDDSDEADVDEDEEDGSAD